MNRHLFLISNSGGESDYLPGVEIDMENYEKFFTSAGGGAWIKDTEIVEMFEAGYESIFQRLNFLRILESPSYNDYWIVVFSGHGYAIRENGITDTILCLADGKKLRISTLKSWIGKRRCLFIIDCCREVTDISVPEIVVESLFSDDRIQLNPETCRAAYNRMISITPVDYYEAYSTSLNERAGDSDKYGGIYSYNLIKAANEGIKNLISSRQPGSVLWPIHQKAAEETSKMRKGKQNPVATSNINKLPFIVAM